jgi:putative glutamine amidotransferase
MVNIYKKIRYTSKLQILLIALVLLTISCSQQPQLRIAVSKASGSVHYLNYPKWLQKAGNVEIVDMINLTAEQAVQELETCSGLLLTGGPDVHPGRFGKEYDTSRCEIDSRRDTLEFALIKKALELKLPILGICRGEQILNVAMKGTLIVDIPSDYDTTVIHRSANPPYPKHKVSIAEGSLLSKICDVKEGEVNSSHHQAVAQIAETFIVNAKAPDGLIEGFEWKQPQGKPFLMAVQWHPERLEENNPLSLPIAKYFLKEAKKNVELSKN